jgi:hypothetical protein
MNVSPDLSARSVHEFRDSMTIGHEPVSREDSSTGKTRE